MMSIPCTYVNETLTINSLRLSANGATAQEAYEKAIVDMKGLKAALSLGVVQKDTDSLKRTFFSVVLPFNEKVHTYLDDLEPVYVEKIKKKSTGKLVEATAEEVIELGY